MTDLAALLLLALLLDALLGEPDWLWSRVPHPAVLMGNAISWCDKTFNSGGARRLRGALVIAALVAAAVLVGWVLSALPLGPMFEVVLAAILLAQRSLVTHVADVAQALRVGLADGRMMVARIVGRDTRDLDESGVARGAIESAAENLSDGVIAPAFWFLLLGLPGILAYKMINTADSMIGYRTPRHEAFGWAAARLDDLVNWVPARLTAGLLMIGAGRLDLWPMIRANAVHHRSPNAGWPEAAMAGALDVALSGPRSYDGQMREEPFVNPKGRRGITPDDIDRAVHMLWRAWGIVVLFLAGAALF
ncbi:adenosylcobinamide-phosphate synthase CbiB [Litoreibacter roseus]|uniref:Cobalamin biosynthesis protein CobD n=1 Tax=Litoreibacter roseus TaxID=2601869 RepID=A0A6N6JGP5_9RHOB|nr:adenosylcobinamide-phosphate synthase CbiB [Litoreibacter roseus]GFE65010.1 cobalamin biosynthesis protein CobD [Litoreibacter roseus]